MFEGLLRKIDSWLFGEKGAEVLWSDEYTISEERAAEILAEEDIAEEPEESAEDIMETAARVEAEIAEQAEEKYGELVSSGMSGFEARILAWDWRESREQEYYFAKIHKGGLLSALWIALMVSISS